MDAGAGLEGKKSINLSSKVDINFLQSKRCYMVWKTFKVKMRGLLARVCNFIKLENENVAFWVKIPQ